MGLKFKRAELVFVFIFFFRLLSRQLGGRESWEKAERRLWKGWGRRIFWKSKGIANARVEQIKYNSLGRSLEILGESVSCAGYSVCYVCVVLALCAFQAERH